MGAALGLAREAAARGEVPIGAVVVARDRRIASAHNQTVAAGDPTAHAELIAISEGARAAGAKRLTQADLYVTLEPCPMCAQAIAFARLRRLYFGAYDPKGGGVEHGPRIFAQSGCNHRPEIVGGVEERRAAALLRGFFRERR
jgi:tRNA(Arg) A34 adenosine deaminase TadA